MPVTPEEDVWIKDVEIVNFQSLRNVHVKFINGTNALIGVTNSGKTAIIRAIIWCLINRPHGDHFITVDEKEAMVRISLSNGKEIERRKSASTNTYRLFNGGELVNEFTGFGRNVPDEIIEAHGIRPLAGDTYFQFGTQLESAFMLSLPPSKRAAVLGNMDELYRIDTALAGINKEISDKEKLRKEMQRSKKEIKRSADQLAMKTEKARTQIEALKALKKGFEHKYNMHTYVSGQVERLKEVNELLRKLNTELDTSNRVLENWPEGVEGRIEKAQSITKQVSRLKEIQQSLQSIKFMKDERLQELELLKNTVEEKVGNYKFVHQALLSLKENTDSIAQIKSSFSDRAAGLDVSQLENDIGKFKLIHDHVNKLQKINQDIKGAEDTVEDANGQISIMLDRFVDALQEAGVCPTCGQDTHAVCTSNIDSVI